MEKLKTNFTLDSESLNVLGLNIRVNSKDEFMSLTDLQRTYDFRRATDKTHWSVKEIKDVTKAEDFQRSLYYVLIGYELINANSIETTQIPAIQPTENQLAIKGIQIPVIQPTENQLSIFEVKKGYITEEQFLENIKQTGFVAYMKQLELWKTQGARHTKNVMAHPAIWFHVLKNINPEFDALSTLLLHRSWKVIQNRNAVGESFKRFTTALMNSLGKDWFDENFPLLMHRFNECCYGKNYPASPRKTATIEQTELQDKIQNDLATLLDFGAIKSGQEVLEYIQNNVKN